MKIQLVSTHIPKTGGVSFRTYLKDRFGFRLRLIYDRPTNSVINNGGRLKNPFWKSVIHGHFFVQPEFLNKNGNPKVITWLRDPADRFISHYFYWKNQTEGHDPFFKKFQELSPSLVEFATLPEFELVRSTYQYYIGKLSPEQFLFIGRTENFEEDLLKLDRILFSDKKPVDPKKYFENKNFSKPKVSDDELAVVKEALEKEYLVYHSYLNHFH